MITHYLSSLPIWTLVLLIVVIPTLGVIAFQVYFHHVIGVEQLAQNNEIAGFKFATVGVIYAVLLAFSVIAVWEKFSSAETAVDQEAASIAALFRYGAGPEPEAASLTQAVAAYAQSAISREWHEMSRDRESDETTNALNLLYDSVQKLSKAGTRNTADMTEVFAQVDRITSARRVRLHLAMGLVPGVVWLALFAGAVLTVGFTLFFGSRNLKAQAAMTGILSTLVMLGLVVIISIDHPFTGSVRVGADPIESVLADFHSH